MVKPIEITIMTTAKTNVNHLGQVISRGLKSEASIVKAIVNEKIGLKRLLLKHMRLYNTHHLHQCVRNLFAQAKYELRAVHGIEERFAKAIERDEYSKVKVFSLWDNGEDCFYAMAFNVWRIKGSKILLELAVYVNYSDYMAEGVVGSVESPVDVFAWLNDKGNLQLCVERAKKLISQID